MAVLEIKDLHVSREGKEILKGVNLKTGPGEVHAIMGPNGSGKSTLAYTCLLYTSPSPRDKRQSRMPSSA